MSGLERRIADLEWLRLAVWLWGGSYKAWMRGACRACNCPPVGGPERRTHWPDCRYSDAHAERIRAAVRRGTAKGNWPPAVEDWPS